MASEIDPCPLCRSPRTTVAISVEDRVVTMRSCNQCDRRWWTADGEDVDPTVLFAKKSA